MWTINFLPKQTRFWLIDSREKSSLRGLNCDSLGKFLFLTSHYLLSVFFPRHRSLRHLKIKHRGTSFFFLLAFHPLFCLFIFLVGSHSRWASGSYLASVHSVFPLILSALLPHAELNVASVSSGILNRRCQTVHNDIKMCRYFKQKPSRWRHRKQKLVWVLFTVVPKLAISVVIWSITLSSGWATALNPTFQTPILFACMTARQLKHPKDLSLCLLNVEQSQLKVWKTDVEEIMKYAAFPFLTSKNRKVNVEWPWLKTQRRFCVNVFFYPQVAF